MVVAASAGGCAVDVPEPQLGSSAAELTQTATFQSGVNGTVDDSFISATEMRRNFGNERKLRVSAKNEALLRFDLSSVPANAVINKAELTVTVSGGDEEDDDDCRDGDHEGQGIAPIKLRRVTAAWAEGTVTYKSFDQAFDPGVVGVIQLGNRRTTKTVDVKSAVQAWVSGSKPNYGLVFTTAGKQHTLIVSSEQSPVSQRPALKVTYTTPDDHCQPDRCQHGGTCSNRPNDYVCECPAGYRGHDCQIDINECAGNPCRHGGECTDQIDGYVCTCEDGWTGANCESEVSECDADPCQNGGVCTETEQQACGRHGRRHRGHGYGHHGHHGHHGDGHDDDGDGHDDDGDGDGDGDEPGYTCACPPGTSGANCETTVDDCASDPCLNGATCADGVNGFTCTCAPGFSGSTCAVNLDDCAGSPCLNGGTCADGVDSYTCSCASGFTGTRCETNIDECAGSPCLNGGTCADGIVGYTCGCAAGYAGANCETDIDDCAGSPCQNGGLCVDGVDSHTCQCASGYEGADCTINHDDCAPDPCQNGGACADGLNDHTCTCAAGFEGQNCEINTDDCAPNPCLNGGTCIDGDQSYACSCAVGHVGPTCEIVAAACQTGAVPVGDAGLIGRWTFDDRTDSTGNFDPLELEGNATIAGGMLDVNADSGAPAEATGWAHAVSRPGLTTIRDKTLVSWISLDSLDARSGSALTLDSATADRFDGIVYAERVAAHWMNGSNDYARTPLDGAPFAETATNKVVQVAISYRDLGGSVEITLCRDGVQIGQYLDSPMAEWALGDAEVIFGRRHTFAGPGARGGLDAHIEEARVYDTALGCDQLCAVCGDGIVAGAEACDDGNTVSGDGCSATCAAEGPPGSVAFAGHYYLRVTPVGRFPVGLIPGGATDNAWFAADAYCANAYPGGHLPSVGSAEENAFLRTMLPNANQGIMLGLGDDDHPFAWFDGTPFDYTNWSGGQPSHNLRFRFDGLVQDHYGLMQADGRWVNVPHTDIPVVQPLDPVSPQAELVCEFTP